MNTQQSDATTERWKRPLYLVLVVAAFAMVVAAWFQTPQVRVDSTTAGDGSALLRCANAGPSRWDPPTVRPGQDLAVGAGAETTNMSILKNDLEDVRVSLACDQARSAHTDTLVVTVFAAGAILFFGRVLWKRRSGVESSTGSGEAARPRGEQ